MLKGLDIFAEAFAGHRDKYALIGGTACYLNLLAAQLPFRATTDLDIVLIAEDLDSAFIHTLRSFLEAGGYAGLLLDASDRRSYRFSKPATPGYPALIELFSRRPDAMSVAQGQHRCPLLVEGIATSLSVILLNDTYYDLIRHSTWTRSGCTVVPPESLMIE
jgi:hypothetical protein